MAKEQIDGDAFKVVASGQPVVNSARRHNILSEVAKEFIGQRSGGMSAPGAYVAGGIGGAVEITNSSGAAVGAFEVLGISGVAINHTENGPLFETRIMLTGVTPTTADHAGKFAVTAEPLADGQIGKCYVQGVFPAQVNIVTEGDKWCDVKDSDETQLESSGAGSAQILWAESGTGKKWCIIRIGSQGRSVEVLRLDSAATPGGTYNATVRTPPTADIPAGTNFEDADLGGDGEEVLVLNLKEQGAATHELVDAANTDDRNCIGLYLYTNSDGVRVFVTDKIWLGCPPDDPISDWV